ncbi:hypothetical protein MASR2M17_16410 [Aminivibrio sp.]
MSFERLSSERVIIIVKPSTAIIKYSGGPKERAKAANGGAMNKRTKTPKIPQLTRKLGLY